MDPAIFNTDDIIGVYPDQLGEEDAWKIGCAAARFLRSLLRGYERGQANAQSLCVGRDTRTHSPQMAKALIDGISTTGTNVIDIGTVDTPQMYFAVSHLGTCGGIQITGSHCSAKYTGLKLCGLDAKPVSTDTGLKDIEHIAMALLHTKGRATGSVSERDVTAEYKNHVLKFLSPNPKKMKVAVDASNGMAGKVVPAVFGGLPIDIVPVNFDHAGKFKHEPNPLVEKNLNDLRSAVTKHKCAFGICFDSDADRLAVLDEKGHSISSDLVATLMVPYFLEKQARSTVAYDLRCSRILVEEIIKHGGTPRRERVGQAYMKKALHDSHAVFGCGLSGHFYYRDNYCAESGMITLVHLINIVSQATTPLSAAIAQLRRYHSSDQVDLEVENKQAKLDELARRYSDGQIDHLDGMTIGYKDWWFNCRPDKNEPLLHLRVEAKSKELLDEKLLEMTQRPGKTA